MPFPTSSSARSGKYTDIRPIGTGAYGQVYYAKDNLGRDVAVKEVLPTNRDFEQFRAKFQKEARIQAAFRHPNIVYVYYLEEDADTRELYLVCEYVNAGSLADHLQQVGPLSERQAITVALAICAALEETWSKRIIHRDVKPSNILLVKDEQGEIVAAKLGDFGIAQDQKQRSTTVIPGMGYPGTVLYMAPEQGNAANVLDVRADLYALGITLWEMLTKEEYKLLAQNGPPDLRRYNAQASARIAGVIQRAVQDDPAQRYPTPQAMADDLRAVLAGNQPYTDATLPAGPSRDQQLPAPGSRRPMPRPSRWQKGIAGVRDVSAGLAPLLIFGLGGALIAICIVLFAFVERNSQAAAVANTPTPPNTAADTSVTAGAGNAATAASNIPANAVTIQVVYSPEKERWLTERFAAFNATHPTVDGRPIVVEGINKSSGEARTEIKQGTLKPAVWTPSDSAWLEVLKQEQGNQHVAVSSRPLVRTPVVIAMWKPMAEALGWPKKPIAWHDLLALNTDAQGWAKYGHPEWGRFTWGHTDPEISTTALSTILAEVYASTGKTRGLTVADVQSPSSQQFLRQLAQGIKHYGYNTLVFSDNMKKYGMSYISAIPLEEQTLVDFNQNAPPTPLVALYPSDGTFWHDNPFIAMAGTPREEQLAADQLYAFLTTPESQRAAMQLGYRPATAEVPLGPPLTEQNGVDPAQPRTLLDVPPADVLVAAKNAWAANRKRANIVVVVDISGSMQGEKIEQAKAGLDLFLSRLLPDDRVALITFSDTPKTVVPLGPLSDSRNQLQAAVQNIDANGYTALYDALLEARKVLAAEVNQRDRINAIVLLSDGEDTSSTSKLADVQRTYGEGAIPVFPIAYGSDADKATLTAIADFTRALLIEGGTGEINKIFENLSRYF